MLAAVLAASVLAAFASADVNETAAGFKMTCNSDQTLTVFIPYYKEAVLLSVDYGTCNETTDVRVEKTGDDNFNFEITLDIMACGMDGNLRSTLDYNQTAELTIGRWFNNVTALHFSDFTVESYCSYEDTYNVTFSYGTIHESGQTFNGTGGVVSLEFQMQAYTSNYSAVISSTPTQAGDMIYLGLSVVTVHFDHTGKMFVPLTCSVQTTDGSNHQYTLFNYQGKCTNDLINLDLSYDDATNVWRIQHILFLLGSKVATTYELNCSIQVCDKSAPGTCGTAKTCFEN